MSQFYENLTHRTALVTGAETIARISSAKIIIFGLGGVGSWCAEALVRSGVINLTIVDSDVVCATNINRQIQATSENIGKIKSDELKKRLLSINPEAEIVSINSAFREETQDNFNLESFDYVVDAIDSLKNKVLLIELCLAKKINFISSMGAGARSDPSKIRISTLAKTNNCSLARAVRQRLRKKRVSEGFLCVYSEELAVKPAIESACGTDGCACSCSHGSGNQSEDWCSLKKQINGSLVHITGIFGFFLAGAIIQDLMGKKNFSIPKK